MTSEQVDQLDDEAAYDRWLAEMQEQGFHRWPDHVPLPLDGYRYSIHVWDVRSMPRCSFWHRLIFRLPRRAAWWIYEKSNLTTE